MCSFISNWFLQFRLCVEYLRPQDRTEINKHPDAAALLGWSMFLLLSHFTALLQSSAKIISEVITSAIWPWTVSSQITVDQNHMLDAGTSNDPPIGLDLSHLLIWPWPLENIDQVSLMEPLQSLCMALHSVYVPRTCPCNLPKIKGRQELKGKTRNKAFWVN